MAFLGAQISRVGASEKENALMLLAPGSSVGMDLQDDVFPLRIPPLRGS